MIELKTGAILDKELEITDYSDGRMFGPKLGWLLTFHPCRVCRNDKCRRSQYGPCDDEYFKLWKQKFLKGRQLKIENYGGKA
ncbi:MAG: hypothetical protein IKN41_05000 [Candidatus Methanomethylophilaceae archaeon]|nr:hypothetical protein [Candidatus Methanomethylophilaceae archaeon]